MKKEDFKRTMPGEFYSPCNVKDKETTINNIEDARKEFLSFMNKAAWIKRIVLLSFLVLMGVLMTILIINKDSVNKIFVPSLIVFFVYALFVLIFLSFYKKEREVVFSSYKKKYLLELDSYVFNKDGVTNLELSYNTNLEKELVNKFNVFDEVSNVVFRDYVKGTYNKTNFKCVESLIRVNNSFSPFSGRLFIFNVKNNKGEGVIYLRNKGKGEVTSLEGLEPTIIKNLRSDFRVYLTPTSSSLITLNTVNALNAFTREELIDDIIIKINKEEIIVGISYVDEMMTIPYENSFNEKYLDQYNNDVIKVFNLTRNILSNKNYSL
jgi:hypothetical protein